MSAIAENTPRAWSERANGGSSWEAAGCSEFGQTQRFLAVRDRLELRAGDALLDYGAGTGRFCEFVPREVDYFAFDTAGGMRDRCAIEHPRATVLSRVPDSLFDHVIAIGPFNLAHAWSLEQTFDALANLWTEHVRRSLIACLYRGDDRACLHYDPMTVTAWAGRLGARRYVIDASYLDNDLLLGLYR